MVAVSLPAFRPVMRNWPCRSETAVAPPGSSVTCAPCRTPPLLSETLPLRMLLEDWAAEEIGKMRKTSRAAERNRGMLLLSFNAIAEPIHPNEIEQFREHLRRRSLNTPAVDSSVKPKRPMAGERILSKR